MSRTAARFTQTDLNRAIRGAKQAGAAAVLLQPDGTIRIEFQPSNGPAASTGSDADDGKDAVL